MNEMTTNRTADMIAAEINMIKAQARDVYVRSAIEIGRRLYEAKTMVPHGKWGKWLAENVDYSDRTAQNLIAVYEEYGRGGETQVIEGLSFTQAVLLLRLDGESRAELLETKDVPGMSTRELEEEIRRANAEIEKRQITIERLLSGAESISAENAAAQTELAAAQAASEAMREELEKARADAERARAQAMDAVERANAAAKENAALKGDLEMERRRAPVIEQVEVTPPEVEKELERLRAIEKNGPNEQTLRLRVTYTQMIETLGKIESMIREMEQSQPEEATRYRRAVAAAAMKIAKRLGGA